MEYMQHLAILFSGVAAAGGGILLFLAAREHVNEQATIRVIREVAQLYSCMQRAVNNTPANRALILMLSNGGRLLSLHDRKYITVLDEVRDGSVQAVMQDYEKFPADAGYLRMINRLIDEKEVTGATRELAPGMLRDAYEQLGVTHFVLYYIGFRAGRHYYGSVTTTEGVPLINPATYNELRILFNNVRGIFRRRKISFTP